MPKIIIQAGHEGRTSGSTGAPGEQKFNIAAANLLADKLRGYGFEVKRVKADPTAAELAGDHDLFLAVHYDADVYNDDGGFVDFPEPSTDGATAESQRIAKCLTEEFFSTTGIKCMPNRSNKNTRFYYMWSKLSAKTPCVLIECGVGNRRPRDFDTLNGNLDLVIKGLLKGILKAFNIPMEESMTDDEKRALDIVRAYQVEAKHGNLEGAANAAVGAARDIPKLNKKISDLEKDIENLTKTINEINGKLSAIQKSATQWQTDLETAKQTITKMEEDIDKYRPYKALYENKNKEYNEAVLKSVDNLTTMRLLQIVIKRLAKKS